MPENRFDRYYGGKQEEDSFTPPSEFGTETLKLSGSSDIEKADARLISIAGSCRVTDYARCETFDVSGSLHVGGTVSAHSISFSGSAEIGGGLRCISAETSGSCRINGASMVGDKMHASGSISFEGGLRCGELTAEGHIRMPSLTAELVKIDGAGSIGTVTCAGADINSGRAKNTWLKLMSGRSQELKVETMTVDNAATLGACNIAELTTGSARLIKGCRIGTLRYRDSYDAEDGSTIGNAIKID